MEKIKTKVLRSILFFFENRVVYEIMWKNVVDLDRPQMIIWRMRITFWITKATDTHYEYVILLFPLRQRLRERFPVLRLYVRRLSC